MERIAEAMNPASLSLLLLRILGVSLSAAVSWAYSRRLMAAKDSAASGRLLFLPLFLGALAFLMVALSADSAPRPLNKASVGPAWLALSLLGLAWMQAKLREKT